MQEDIGNYPTPATRYFKTRTEFDMAVGRDFITHANLITNEGEEFFVGLAHGMSPSGAYQYILDHFNEINHPNLLKFTATNSHLKRQRDLKDVLNATEFLKALLKKELIVKDQVIGRRYNREQMQDYADTYNYDVANYLERTNKEGFDYVFIASDSRGRVAAITRKSTAFDSEDIMVVVNDRRQEELTISPHFLKKSNRIAFLATKADKRRPLAWLYSRWGSPNESPSFLRYVEDVAIRMTVFVDDAALTWPQIEIFRPSKYGGSTIRIDVATTYNEEAKRKLPVVLLIHGFLGLNSFDGLLTSLPSRKYIGAAMHYGTIPDDLPPKSYSKHIVRNIDAAVGFFGSKGHPVYIFDHSMGNIYFLKADLEIDTLPNIKKYLKGRIGANPFFGTEAKHAMKGFLDFVIIPSFSFMRNPVQKQALTVFRNIVLPLMPDWEVRRQGIQWTGVGIKRSNIVNDNFWEAIKTQILDLMTQLDSVPALNRIPIERALSRLPAKIFAIQIHSTLIVSKKLKKNQGLTNMDKHNIPILILKSRKDGIAKFDKKYYMNSSSTIWDVTNEKEEDLFREHLYHMVNPLKTAKIIDDFIVSIESSK
ncbi:MAG: hypothetical protein R2730_12630 [Chitinophagales bacterium]